MMLNIIYRLCELETNGNLRPHRPKWFSKQKSLQSFLNSLELCKSHVNDVVFVHDGEPGILFEMINNFDVIKINDKSNEKSLHKTLDVADELGGNIYFVEDDYLHLENSISKIDLVLPELKLVNGYDHLDRYTRSDDIAYNLKIVFKNDHHWRTAESTCCTYAIEENLYKEIKNTIREFSLNDRGLFRSLHQMNIPLWTALPGLTTQVDTNLSPGIDWEKFNNNLR